MADGHRCNCKRTEFPASAVLRRLCLSSLLVLFGHSVVFGANERASGREAVLRERLENSPDARWKNELASILYAKGKILEARKLWDEAARQDANFPSADLAVAAVLANRGEFDAANVALNKADDANDPHALIVRSAMAIQKRDLDAAATVLQEAFEQNEQLPRTLLWLGTVHELKQDFEAATSWYRKALALDDANLEAGVKLARLRFLRGDEQGARQVLMALTKVHPDAQIPEVGLAAFAVQAQDFIAARVLYREAIKQHPQSARLHASLARVLIGLKQFAAARKSLQTAAELESTVDTLLSLAALEDQQDQREAARAAYEQILAIDAKHMVANNNMAMLLIRMGDDTAADAITFAKRAIDVAPDHPSVVATWACSLWAAGQSTEAARVLPQAIRRVPNDPWLRYAYGSILLKQGQKERAYQQLEGCLILADRFPRKAEVQRLLATLQADTTVENSE